MANQEVPLALTRTIAFASCVLDPAKTAGSLAAVHRARRAGRLLCISVLFAPLACTPDAPKTLAHTGIATATLALATSHAQRPDSPVMKPVLTGIDILVRDGFEPLRGRKIGLITNQTGVDHLGHRTIDLLYRASDVALKVIFSPEHGLRGEVDTSVADSTDPPTGLPVYSLYGHRTRPSKSQLVQIDTLVFDIQDAGARFFTYITTLGYTLEVAAQNQLKVIVLDRPNPLGGIAVEGPVLDADKESFTGYHPIPIRHGMTVGELAHLFNQERKILADLMVIRMENWQRSTSMVQTGLPWINPSPNLRSPNQLLLYPGLALLELTNVSVGRGTDHPFELVGAPWIHGKELAEALSSKALAGVHFETTSFTPTASTHAGTRCGGVAITVSDPVKVHPVHIGITIAQELMQRYAGRFKSQNIAILLGNQRTWEALARAEPFQQIEQAWQPGLSAFLVARKKHLLY